MLGGVGGGVGVWLAVGEWVVVWWGAWWVPRGGWCVMYGEQRLGCVWWYWSVVVAFIEEGGLGECWWWVRVEGWCVSGT